MSQRGGSVESHVRFGPGEEVYSPLIPAGEADVLLAFEILEALRGLPMTRAGAVVFADDRQIVPMSVIAGGQRYPTHPVGDLRASGRQVHVVPSFEIARALGEPRAANLVLLGAASGSLQGIEASVWPEAIRRSVRPKLVELNVRAFQAGIDATQSARTS